MDVRVMGQGLPPSVQNGEAADPGAQPARIGGERRHWATVRRASDEMGIRKFREGNKSWWQLT
jgi:hypothetical protein